MSRYIAIVTTIVTIGGVAFFSYTNPNFVQKAHAALGATLDITNPSQVLTIDGGGKYMILRDPNCGTGSSVWPLDLNSSNAMKTVKGNVTANFKGKMCLTTSDTVIVQGFSTVSMVGDVSLGVMQVIGGSTLTTAPSDANANAAPYSSRPDYFANRWTGFIKVNAAETISIWPTAIDDAMVIEAGTVGRSVDAGNVNFSVASWDHNGACNVHQSFFGTAENNCANPQKAGTINSPPAKGVRYSISNAGGSVIFIPIRISFWEVTGDAWARIGFNNGGADTVLPLDRLYAPYDTEDGTGRLGTVDGINGQGMMRFEYATGTLGVDPTNNDSQWISRDLSNAGEYAFFARVTMDPTGSFRSFGKLLGGSTDNTNFDYHWANPDTQFSGSPFSNAQRDDSRGYRIGAAPAVKGSGQISMRQNYRLQAHDDNSTGIPAGLSLSTSGDLAIINSTVTVIGDGMPGGIQYSDGYTDRGISGVGGKGSQGSPGVWITSQNSGCDHSYAGHWNIHGGGGGGAGKCISPGPGGGGGGAIGFGAAGMATNFGGVLSIRADHSDSLTDRVKNYGAGGGGLRGVGGGSNGNDVDYYINNSSGSNIHDRYNGSANPGSYTAATMTGMGGGGGQGSNGEDKSYVNNPAGNGGGIIKLTINGSLSANASVITASGDSPGANYGEGAGGAGTIDITVKGTTFDFDASSSLHAVGGSTLRDIQPNNPDTNPATSYPMGGQGGGGLVKVRAVNFGPASGSGWPTDYCSGVAQPFKALFGPNGNINARAGQTPAGYSPTQAGDGLVDLAYFSATDPNGSTFCGVSSASSADVQISKQIQQWTGKTVYNDADFALYIKDNASPLVYWGNSVTTVPGSYVRMKIVISNADPDNLRNVKITDIVPPGFQIMPLNGGNELWILQLPNVDKGLAKMATKPNNADGGTLTSGNIQVDAGKTVEVYYIAKIQNPL